jgi:lactate dehydrogenase-like 2-hydroxyacid dehydrogenase
MKPSLLVLIHLNDASRAKIEAAFEVVYAPDAAERAAALDAHGKTIRAVLTNGTTGLAAADIDRMPQLELLSALGAGYENLAVDHARSRGIVLVNGAGTNDHCVADHAFALLLAVVRDVPQLDQATRAGFEMEIGYHNRKPREGSPHQYFDSVEGLARWSDFLIVATPGGAGTRHLIDEAVFEALGPHGFVVNVSRGSVLDTAALAHALTAGTIAGAALDVYEGEPNPPGALLALRNVVLTPHVGGRSPEAITASVDNFLSNARRHFAGEPVLTPI